MIRQTGLSVLGTMSQTELPDHIRKELEKYRAIRPFLDKCFSLNHDINNPLAGILGYAEFLLSDGDDLTAEQRSSIQQIAECGERIRLLVEGLSEAKAVLGDEIAIPGIDDID